MKPEFPATSQEEPHVPHLIWRWGPIPCCNSRGIPTSSRTTRGSLCHLLKLEWNPADPSARKKDPKFPLNLRSFMIPLHGLQWNSEYLFTTWREARLPCWSSRKSPWGTESHPSVARQLEETQGECFAHALKRPEGSSPFVVLKTGSVFQKEVIYHLKLRLQALFHLTSL